MNIIKRLFVQAIVLSVWNCCLADNHQITVSVNGQELKIVLPINSSTSNAVQRLIAQRIKQSIIDSEIQKAHIVVSDDLLSKCLDLYVEADGENPTNMVNTISAKSELITQALRKVVLDGENKDSVYNQYLSGSISRSEWETWVKSYPTREQIEKLESLIPHTVADLKRSSKDSLKTTIEAWLLFQNLTKDITPSSSEIEMLYNGKYPTKIPPLSEVYEEIKAEATKQSKEAYLNKWWQTQLAESDVKVPTEYSGVMELIKTTHNLPFLPDSIITLLKNEPK